MSRSLKTRVGRHIVYMRVYDEHETIFGPAPTHFATYLTAETLGPPRAYFPLQPGMSIGDVLATALLTYEGQHDTELDKITAREDCHHVSVKA